MKRLYTRLRLIPTKFAGLIVVLLLMSGPAAARALPMSGSGFWMCEFSSAEGYGDLNGLSFSSQDAQGNPITGSFTFGSPHSAPQCTPGIQSFQGSQAFFGSDDIGGGYSYLGKTYDIPGAGYVSISTGPTDVVDVRLGFGSDPLALSYLNLEGIADVTSSDFGEIPVFESGTSIGDYYYSSGGYTLSSAPEPSAGFSIRLWQWRDAWFRETKK